jgi:hypothetical protein
LHIGGKNELTAGQNGSHPGDRLPYVARGDIFGLQLGLISVQVFSEGTAGMIFGRVVRAVSLPLHLLDQAGQLLLCDRLVRTQRHALPLAVFVSVLPIPFFGLTLHNTAGNGIGGLIAATN